MWRYFSLLALIFSAVWLLATCLVRPYDWLGATMIFIVCYIAFTRIRN